MIVKAESAHQTKRPSSGVLIQNGCDKCVLSSVHWTQFTNPRRIVDDWCWQPEIRINIGAKLYASRIENSALNCSPVHNFLCTLIINTVKRVSAFCSRMRTTITSNKTWFIGYDFLTQVQFFVNVHVKHVNVRFSWKVLRKGVGTLKLDYKQIYVMRLLTV